MKRMKWKGTLKHCMLKGKCGKTIIGMQFVGFFHCVNDDREVHLKKFQIKR
jgi:hypothetical protein